MRREEYQPGYCQTNLGRFNFFKPCTNKATNADQTKCGTHDPERTKARRDQRSADALAKWEADRQRYAKERAAAAERDRRAALFDDLVAALEPFAEAAKYYHPQTADGVVVVTYASGRDFDTGESFQKTLSLEQFRAARAIFARAKPTEQKP